MDHRIGIAALSIDAFSGTIDLLHACKFAYEGWRSLVILEDDLKLFRTKLILQEALLDQWRRDWYGFEITGKASIGRLRLLKAHNDVVEMTLSSIERLLGSLEPLRVSASGNNPLTMSGCLLWVTGQKDLFKQTLAEIESLLASLYRLLPLRSPNIEANRMFISLNHSEQEPGSHTIDAILQSESNSLVIERTFGLRSLEASLRADLQRRIDAFQNILPGPALKIPKYRVTNICPDEMSFGSRSVGLFDQQPAVIEWKNYDPSWQGRKGIELRGRIDNLARLLNADSKPEELQTLHCEGYFDSLEESRYGFIFSYPRAVDPKMISLKELLDNRTVESLPTLEDRYQIAYALGLTLAILHYAEWLHKSIRSHNVLLASIQSQVIWSRPYLVGFEFSRPDKPDESSEKPQQSARFNLYRHPLSQGSPNKSFRQSFDIYSFGVILLEIGMWRSACKWWRHDSNAMEFQNTLIGFAEERLAHSMGTEYKDATLKCLNGDLEKRDTSVWNAFFIEVIEVIGRCLVNN